MRFLKGCFTVIGAFFVLAIIAAALLGGQNKQDGATPATATAPASEKAEAKPNGQSGIAKGSWADVRNDRAIKVDRSQTVSEVVGNQFIKPVTAKGGKLVVVYLSLKNTGKESGNMLWTQFQLTDSQGRKYSGIQDFEEIAAVNTWLREQGLEDTTSQLFPGATVQTAKVFRVSPDAAGLTLDVGGKQFGI